MSIHTRQLNIFISETKEPYYRGTPRELLKCYQEYIKKGGSDKGCTCCALVWCPKNCRGWDREPCIPHIKEYLEYERNENDEN